MNNRTPATVATNVVLVEITKGDISVREMLEKLLVKKWETKCDYLRRLASPR